MSRKNKESFYNTAFKITASEAGKIQQPLIKTKIRSRTKKKKKKKTGPVPISKQASDKFTNYDLQ
jgi:hypothetical protein